jgi:hypothetical protein
MRVAGLFLSIVLFAGASFAQGEQRPSPPPLAPPFVEIGAPDHAQAGGEAIAFDGAPQGLLWPALARVYAAKAKPGERIVVAAPRNARVLDVLRVVFTLREADLEVQTLGPGDEVRPLLLPKRPATRPEGPTCHAAFFVSPEGHLRAALPGGAVQVKDTATLVTSIARGASTCRIRWLAFGAESNDMAWGWVFDVAAQVDHAKVAPGARFVLAEKM